MPSPIRSWRASCWSESCGTRRCRRCPGWCFFTLLSPLSSETPCLQSLGCPPMCPSTEATHRCSTAASSARQANNSNPGLWRSVTKTTCPNFLWQWSTQSLAEREYWTGGGLWRTRGPTMSLCYCPRHTHSSGLAQTPPGPWRQRGL